MDKIKTKVSVNGNETTIKILLGAKIIDTLHYVNNKCNYCGEETLNTFDLGKDYICPKCTEYLSARFGGKTKTTTKEEKPKKSLKGYKIKNRTYTAIKDYSSDIKLLNYTDYSNLMENLHISVTEKMATILVDLILKGCNTLNKIHDTLKVYKMETLEQYLYTLSKVGVLYYPDMNIRGDRHNRIYKVHKNLLYTAI